MTWWGWILFWTVFWGFALSYLSRRIWRLWPHARDFARTVSDVAQRAQNAREAANATRREGEQRKGPQVTALLDSADVAWNRPSGHWRGELRRSRLRRRELRLDDHTRMWASWRRRLD